MLIGLAPGFAFISPDILRGEIPQGQDGAGTYPLQLQPRPPSGSGLLLALTNTATDCSDANRDANPSGGHANMSLRPASLQSRRR